jgi:transposase DDE domain
MYQLCRFQGKEFKPLLELPSGCPNKDTFERVMQAVYPDEIATYLEVYTSQIIKDLSGMHIAIDAKKMRGTNPRGHGESSYILSAWVNEHSLSIAQEAVGEKTNEITCVPKLLDKLALEGAVVTMDDMDTQVEIVEQMVKKKADFVFVLKGNQRHLFEDTTDAFSTRQPHKRHLEPEKGYGRIDKRRYKVLPAEGNITVEVARRWPMIPSLMPVKHEVTKPNAQPTKETRYNISSLDFNELSTKEIAYYIREHWVIENRLHWPLDVTFREDACRARKNFSALKA